MGTLWAIKDVRVHTSVVACTSREICTCIVFHISFRISSVSFAHRFMIFASSFSLLVILCLGQVSLEIFSIFSIVSCSFVFLCGHELVPCAHSFPLQFSHLLSLLSVITSPISEFGFCLHDNSRLLYNNILFVCKSIIGFIAAYMSPVSSFSQQHTFCVQTLYLLFSFIFWKLIHVIFIRFCLYIKTCIVIKNLCHTIFHFPATSFWRSFCKICTCQQHK